MVRKRDLRFVRRQAIVSGALREPDVRLDEVVEALRQEVIELRARLAEARSDKEHSLATPR
jgi:uncharacterized protein YceH (UPF0502 family)